MLTWLDFLRKFLIITVKTNFPYPRYCEGKSTEMQKKIFTKPWKWKSVDYPVWTWPFVGRSVRRTKVGTGVYIYDWQVRLEMVSKHFIIFLLLLNCKHFCSHLSIGPPQWSALFSHRGLQRQQRLGPIRPSCFRWSPGRPLCLSHVGGFLRAWNYVSISPSIQLRVDSFTVWFRENREKKRENHNNHKSHRHLYLSPPFFFLRLPVHLIFSQPRRDHAASLPWRFATLYKQCTFPSHLSSVAHTYVDGQIEEGAHSWNAEIFHCFDCTFMILLLILCSSVFV